MTVATVEVVGYPSPMRLAAWTGLRLEVDENHGCRVVAEIEHEGIVRTEAEVADDQQRGGIDVIDRPPVRQVGVLGDGLGNGAEARVEMDS